MYSFEEKYSDETYSDGYGQESHAEVYYCQWEDCDHVFTEAPALLEHLVQDHVGRKATNNLCLVCRWKDCGISTAKRDHIISHVRVHVPYQPFQCGICSKKFKRRHDLTKHERKFHQSNECQRKEYPAMLHISPSFSTLSSMSTGSSVATPDSFQMQPPLQYSYESPFAQPAMNVAMHPNSYYMNMNTDSSSFHQGYGFQYPRFFTFE